MIANDFIDIVCHNGKQPYILHLYHLFSRKNIENMKINRLIFTLGMMAIAITAHGQTSTISGVLLDSLTHEGEPYATIRVYKVSNPQLSP